MNHKVYKSFTFLLTLIGISLFMTACGDSDLEDAAEDAGDAIKNVGDAVGDGAAKAKDAAKEVADDVKDATN